MALSARIASRENERGALILTVTKLVEEGSTKDREKLILGLNVVLSIYLASKYASTKKADTSKTHREAHQLFYDPIKEAVMSFTSHEEERDAMFGRLQYWLAGKVREITAAALKDAETKTPDKFYPESG